MKNTIFKIVPAQSTIEWIGKKITGAHDGTVDIKSGEIELSPEGNLVGGRIAADTTSIKVLDIADPATNEQMRGHLASGDFFSSEKFPEAVVEITSADGPHVNANLTIKGISHPVSFDVNLSTSESVLVASARLIIDRTKYGMKFRSGNFFMNLGDTLIYDDFELHVSLTAREVKHPEVVLQ